MTPTAAPDPDQERFDRIVHRSRRMLVFSARSQIVDAVLLAGFWLVDAAPLWLAGAFLLSAWSVLLLHYAVLGRPFTRRLADPSLTLPNLMVFVLLLLAGILLVPAVAIHFLAGMFIVFAFGLFGLTGRGFLVLWALAGGGLALVLYVLGPAVLAPPATPGGMLMVWLVMGATLGRVVLLSRDMRALQRRVSRQGVALAASLQQVEELASRDALTGIYNRRSLNRLAQEALEQAERNGGGFAVALLDIDHFKRVNDGHGHPTGDAVLQAFAQAVQARTRVADRFGRCGGEEFLVILHGTADGGVMAALERMHRAIQEYDWNTVVPGLRITASIGAAIWEQGESIEGVTKRADEALYQAKAGGRNRIVVAAQPVWPPMAAAGADAAPTIH